jgi:C1A family cysteine protease
MLYQHNKLMPDFIYLISSISTSMPCVAAPVTYSDLKPFFANPENKKKAYAPAPNATIQQAHAVFIVGYDNDKEFYIVKNSWGREWADGGFFRVSCI